MFNWLRNLFKPSLCKKSYNLPPMSPLERRVYVYLRNNRPADSTKLHEIVGTHNLGSVIHQLRKKGFVIEVSNHHTKTTYLLRNRKCH